VLSRSAWSRAASLDVLGKCRAGDEWVVALAHVAVLPSFAPLDHVPL
jgi:hypothetical protein